VLELTVPFEPVPLYAVLRARGFNHVVVQSSASAHVVRFVRPGLAGPSA
jgi:hypothetical protein